MKKQNNELLEILVDEKNTEITRLYEQLKAKDKQLASKDEQLRVKDVQIAEKDKQLDQQQQLTLAAMEDSKRLQLELNEAKAEFEEIQTKQKKLFKSKKNKQPLRKDYLLVSLVKNRLIRRSWDESSSLFYKEMMMFLGRNYGKAI